MNITNKRINPFLYYSSMVVIIVFVLVILAWIHVSIPFLFSIISSIITYVGVALAIGFIFVVTWVAINPE